MWPSSMQLRLFKQLDDFQRMGALGIVVALNDDHRPNRLATKVFIVLPSSKLLPV